MTTSPPAVAPEQVATPPAGDTARRGDLSKKAVSRLAMAVIFLPFVVAAIVLIFVVRDSYLPMSDHALIEMHIRDIGHHPVLTGLYSRDDWSHPGPMLFYVLAPFYWFTGGASIALGLGALAINGASVAGMAVIARRRGGVALMVCTLFAISLLIRTLSTDFVRDPWNNYVTVLPYGLLIFLVWSMLAGERWALPVGVVTASFVAQTHVGFLVLATPLFLFGAVWLIVSTLRSADRAARLRLASTVGLSLLIAVVLWLPVIIDAVVNRPSNASRIIRYFQNAQPGIHTLAEGWRVVSGQFAVVPEWLTSRQPSLLFSAESPFLYKAPFPVLLVLVGLAGWVFWRLRHGDGLRLVATLVVSFVLGVIAVDRTIGLVLNYRLAWTWILGMVGFVVALWCALIVLNRRGAETARRIVLGVALAGLVACTVVNVTTAARAGIPQRADGKVLEALMPGVLDDLARDPNSKRGQVVVDDAPPEQSAWYSRSLVLQLEERGYDARMPPPRGFVVGDHRQADGGPVAVRLVVASDREIKGRDADPGLHRIAKWSSVSAERERSFDQAAEALDREYESGRMDGLQYTRAMGAIYPGNVDPAVAWAVAVYRADPSPAAH